MSEVIKLKKNITSTKFFIVSISVVVFLCVIGIGYSNWDKGIGLSSFFSTGSMNVVFDSCEVLEEKAPSPDEPADAKVSNLKISHKGKNLDFAIENAYPGYWATIKFKVINNGDIPVYCKLVTGVESNLIKIDNPPKVLEANGGNGEGTFKITVPESETESTKCNLDLSLEYVQYNEIG